jgi:hypothetical protein
MELVEVPCGMEGCEATTRGGSEQYCTCGNRCTEFSVCE